MSNHAPLKAAGLTKRYGDRDVVSDVNLDLNPGEITALVGMSGFYPVKQNYLAQQTLSRSRNAASVSSSKTSHYFRTWTC
jgi:ABC-type transporter Mla maintaining outer membrane lipid asymmetry ATPase subunit MlaF